MQAQLNKILEQAREQLVKAETMAQTDEIRVKLLGKKGQLTEILRGMGKLSPEERKTTGQMANKVRAEIETLLEKKFSEVKAAAKEAKFRLEKIDVTEPGREVNVGVKHPLTITMDEISKVFMNMGFSIVEGPEVETVFNNFDALNAGSESSGKRRDRYILHLRGYPAENTDVPCTGQDSDETEASDQGDLTGQMFQMRYS